MSDEHTLSIRPIRSEDVLKLEALGHRAPGLARHRLEGQEKHLSLFLLALVGEEIVGHAVLAWITPDPPALENCANVTDVWVRPDWRRRGIATALLEACESVATDQRFARIGLSVGVDNVGAQALYARHGYVPLDLPAYRESGRWVDANGQVVEWAETCRYLAKGL